MIHQELSPVPEMAVAENIYLGREPVNRFGLIDKRRMTADTRALLDQLDLHINPRWPMKRLSVAQTQMVEIAKAISFDSRLIIMDEPTSAITEREVDHLHRMIKSLRESGVAIIYITHKLDEVFEISDDVTVFRDGRLRHHAPGRRAKSTQARHADGRPRADPHVPEAGRAHRRRCSLGAWPDPARRPGGHHLRPAAGRDRRPCRADGRRPDGGPRGDLRHHPGGLRHYRDPRQAPSDWRPADAITYGLALLTEDRKRTGIMGVLSVRDNMVDRQPASVQPGRPASPAPRSTRPARPSGKPWRSRLPRCTS